MEVLFVSFFFMQYLVKVVNSLAQCNIDNKSLQVNESNKANPWQKKCHRLLKTQVLSQGQMLKVAGHELLEA